jgi:NADH-quinone oxidoreductase subunit L
VHLGVFLLLRTFPFWEHQLSVRILIGCLGLITSLVATGIARVQSSVKSQIAYSAIAQIGLIFIEIALGFQNLALFHFAANAFLRTYQLLISPSVVSYLIREQFYNFVPRQHTLEDSLPKRIEYTLYMLCLREWNLDGFMYRYLWYPLKWAGNKLSFINANRAFIFTLPVFALGIAFLYAEEIIPHTMHQALPIFFAIVGLLTVLRSFTERRNVHMSWVLILMNHFWIALAISFNEHFEYSHTVLYLSGIVVAGVLGYFCLSWLKARESHLDLNQFHGFSFEYPKLAFIFLLACLGISGFPITPTFVGEDLIFSHIHEDQVVLALLASLCFILDGLSVVRIYARVFMGPYTKSIDKMAYRSS